MPEKNGVCVVSSFSGFDPDIKNDPNWSQIATSCSKGYKK
jgi:hypothetical protein